MAAQATVAQVMAALRQQEERKQAWASQRQELLDRLAIEEARAGRTPNRPAAPPAAERTPAPAKNGGPAREQPARISSDPDKDPATTSPGDGLAGVANEMFRGFARALLPSSATPTK